MAISFSIFAYNKTKTMDISIHISNNIYTYILFLILFVSIGHIIADIFSQYTMKKPLSCSNCMSFWVSVVLSIVYCILDSDYIVLTIPFISYIASKILNKITDN